MKHVYLLIFAFILSSCSSDEVDPTTCDANEFYNQITEKCVVLRNIIKEPDLGNEEDAMKNTDTGASSDTSADVVETDLGDR